MVKALGKLVAITTLSTLLFAGSARADTCATSLMPLFTGAQAAELCGAFSAGVIGTLANNTYLVARNAADSANLSLLKADTTDDTVLNADTGDVIKLSVAGTSEVQIDNDSLTFTGAAASIVGGATSLTIGSAGSTIISPANDVDRLFTFAGSSDTALSLGFGDGDVAVQKLTVSALTADADDDASLQLTGGGAYASDGSRGASIVLPGEEVSGGSDITYNAGPSDTHIFAVAGTAEQTLSDDTITYSGAASSLIGGATSLTLGGSTSFIMNPASDAQRLHTFSASSDTALTQKFGDAGVTASQVLTVSGSAADADDDTKVIIAGGGAAAVTRGAYMVMSGNEESAFGSAGYMNFYTGDIANSRMDFQLGVASGLFRFKDAGGNVMWTLDDNGLLYNTASQGGDISLAATGTTIAIQEATAGSKCMGTATANGTTAVTVSTTCVTTASRIFISRTSAVAAGVTEPGCWATNIVNVTSFDLDCNDAAEDSTFNWIIFHEAA